MVFFNRIERGSRVWQVMSNWAPTLPRPPWDQLKYDGYSQQRKTNTQMVTNQIICQIGFWQLYLTVSFFFQKHNHEWARPRSIRMAPLKMEDLRIGRIDKSSVKMSNISKLPWGCTAHCTHAHNLGLEQMRLSQYSAEYFQKVKFLQYLKDQADILQKFSKRKWRHEEATFHLHISLLQNMDQDGRNNCYFQFSDWNCYTIWNAGRASNRCQTRMFVFFTLRVVDSRNVCVQRSIFP